MTHAKDDCESLLGQLMPFVEDTLAKYREFFPVAAVMLQSQEIMMVAPSDDDEDQEPDAIIALLNEGFREGVQSGEYRATCVAFDALATHPEKDTQQDTVICDLDHQDNYSVKVCFPYHFDAKDELVVEDPYAVEGAYEVFGNTTT